MSSKLPFAPDLVQQVVEQGTAIIDNPDLDKKSKREKLYNTLTQLSHENSRFTPVQDILIDVLVAFRTEVVLEKRDKMPMMPETLDKVRELINERFSENPELIRILLESIPTTAAIAGWMKKADFKEEVERRMRDDSLFSPDKRAMMIQNLFSSALKDKNMKAAEMWLKMSGDLKPFVENKDKTLKEFEEFNTALWTNKKNQH
jgi:hypothetical protein